MATEYPVIAGHRRYGSCDPEDVQRQQWFVCSSAASADALARELRSGAQKMRCPYCNRKVRASMVRMGEPLTD